MSPIAPPTLPRSGGPPGPNIYSRGPDAPGQVNLVNVELPAWIEDPAPKFMYLWAPGW